MTAPQVDPRTAGWTADDGTFGARLALIRQRMQWGNVKEAAIACGLPPESWRTWERDGVAPRRIVDIAEQIAAKTGCDYLWLLTGRRVERPVVVTAGAQGTTTGPKVRIPQTTKPHSPLSRTLPRQATRRPARVEPMIAEVMPDFLVAELS